MESERQAMPGGDLGQAGGTTTSVFEKLRVQKGERVEATNGYLGRLVDLLQSKDTGRATHAIIESQDGGNSLYLPVELIWDTQGDTVKVCVSKEEASQLTRIPPQYVH